ncbi:ArgS-related anticodon-binding protein NrtL [Streptomyces chryseus]|uniref:ArgS-related anticodon-binding protein NrtL n=1 Tax=Streptomyces chryseus TaxID=68186 RepID=UPI00110FCE55|nr:DALR anticodon-binding domain-containing protein [Streptomyces chryseus]
MTPAELSRTVLRAVRRAVDADVLRAPVPERAVVERPRPGGRGDYSTNVALKLAGPAGRPAREVAEILRAQLMLIGYDAIVDVEVTGPGFLNFTLAPDAHSSVVRTVLAQGRAYGHGTALAGDVVRVGTGTLACALARIAHALGASVVHTSGAASSTAGAEGCDSTESTDRATQSGENPAERALVARLGPDAAVWHLVWPTATASPDDLLVQRETNPLFRVRYAHARTRALGRNAAALGFRGEEAEGTGSGDAPEARALVRALADHPAVLEAAARHRAPDRLARHLDMTAEAFFRFHDAHPVLPLGDEKPSVAHRSRLALAEATGTVLAGGLSLLGISAPEHL